jgi:hypothetical protein
MPISFKHKLIFIHIPKNAGTAITNAFNMSDIGHHLPIYYKQKYPKEWVTFKKFAVVRNPWDRVVSNYEYAKLEKSYWHSNKNDRPYGQHVDYDSLKDLSFDECINILFNSYGMLKHQGWENQYKYLKLGKSYIDDIEIIKLENLQEELKNKINLEVDIPTINSSEHKHYSTYYINDRLIHKVYLLYKEDIGKFKYKFI